MCGFFRAGVAIHTLNLKRAGVQLMGARLPGESSDMAT